jgi:hypothetical protein
MSAVRNSFITEGDKVQYGSFMVAFDRTKVLGFECKPELLLLEALYDIQKYANMQHAENVTGYEAKALAIQKKIDQLKKCNSICNYKERLLLSVSCVNKT